MIAPRCNLPQRLTASQINQGLVHGLSVGTILQVLSASMPNAEPNTASNRQFVAIMHTTPTTAVVEPVAFDDVPAVLPGDFRTPASCTVAQLDYGSLKLSVRSMTLDEVGSKEMEVDTSQFQRLQDSVHAVRRPPKTR